MTEAKDAILIVEDSHSFAGLLENRIQQGLDVQVELAATLAGAEELIRRNPERFFLALLDLNLPDALEGQIVDAVLARGVPAIVLTGTFHKELQAGILKKGVLDYFVKDNVGVIDLVIHAIDRIRKNAAIRILIADDSRSVRGQLGRFLSRYGFQVLEAEDGVQALEMIAQTPVHLIISDYQMPRMDGVALMKKLRTRHNRDEVAAIGLSGAGDSDLAVQFIKAGANDFLSKPYQPEEMLCRVYQNIDIIERHRELERLATRHHSVLENALDAIITTDCQGRIIDYNPAAEALFGYPRDQVMGRRVAEVIVPDHLMADHHAGFSRHADPDLIPAPLRRRFEIQGRRSDGMVIDLQVALTSVIQDGAPTFTAFIQDVTDRRQLLKSLEETLTVAESGNRAKSEFIANMSHEIRTPMNAVLGFSDLALKADLAPRVRDYLEKIKNASHSLMGIINDILDFSKIEVGRLELDPVKFSLHHLLDRLADLFSKQVADKGIDLVMVAPVAFDDVLEGDVKRLEQVLINLIRNAVKFTNAGAILVNAQPEFLDDQRIRIAFSVSDTGIGIDPETLPRLFAPFVQADGSTTRKYGGTGLGLSICKRLVELMGGRIAAESAPGQGSRFAFQVEVARHAPNQRMPQRVPEEIEGARALVADDHRPSADQLAALLIDIGLDPVVVYSGREAVEALTQPPGDAPPFAFALLDWEMPGMDGLAAALEARAALEAANPGQASPRFFLLTPFGVEQAKVQGERAGMAGFLDKPITRPRLLRTLLAGAEFSLEGVDRRAESLLREEEETANLVGGGRVLLVDDQPINQEVGRELLERVGLVVETANDGWEGLRLVRRFPFDLVLMDVQMAGMDGLETTRKIREEARFADLPIIAVTAHTQSEDIKTFLDAGCSAHLAKPIRSERLNGVLARWMTPTGLDLESALWGDESHPFPDAPGLDLAIGLERVGGDRKLYARLLARFARVNAGAAEALNADWAGGRAEAAGTRVHLIKGSARQIGAVTLRQAAADLEAALADGEDAAERAARSHFLNKLTKLLDGLGKTGETRAADLRPASAPVLGGDLNDLRDAGDRLAPLLNRILVHLIHHSIQAEPLLAELEGLVRATPAASLFRELAQQFKGYNFTEAVALVRGLAERLEIALDPDGEIEALPDGDWILLVDDQRDNVDVLKEILPDFPRMVALNGRQALKIAASNPPPDLILLDIMMPELNGYEVCERLKENPDTRDIPVVFVTAKKEAADESEGFRVGGVDFITKPFNAEIVKRRIINHLELKQHRGRLEKLVARRTRELEEARREAEGRKEAAEAGNLAKSRFLATVSHEIRTPMNAILGMAEALGETHLNAEQRRYVDVFHRAGRGLLALINDVLDLSRVEADRLELVLEPFRLGRFMSATQDIVAARAADKDVTLKLALDSELPAWVLGDRRRIRQVVLNLLDNAVKFTHHGVVTLSIAPDSAAEGTAIRFEVRDTGIGIPEEKLEEIFSGFTQADPTITRRYGGSGLGLTICRRLVALMGGAIQVESVLGEGSCFYFSLPLPAVEETETLNDAGSPETQAPDPSPSQSPSTTPGPPGGAAAVETDREAAILLAEDAQDNVLLIEVFLKGKPYQLTVAWDGQEAVELFERERFDLILMDVQMPRLDGYSATREIRRMEAEKGLPRTPVVTLTAHAFAEESQRAMEAGCDDFLTKPLTKKRLLEAIEAGLAGRKDS